MCLCCIWQLNRTKQLNHKSACMQLKSAIVNFICFLISIFALVKIEYCFMKYNYLVWLPSKFWLLSKKIRWSQSYLIFYFISFMLGRWKIDYIIKENHIIYFCTQNLCEWKQQRRMNKVIPDDEFILISKEKVRIY